MAPSDATAESGGTSIRSVGCIEIAAGAVAVSSCSGNVGLTSPSAITTTQPPTPAPSPAPPPPTPAPNPVPPSITFTFDDGVLPDDRLGIEDGINLGYAFLQSQFQWQLAESITIRATTTSQFLAIFGRDGVASAARDRVTVNTGNSNWRVTSDPFRRKVMVHELFHVLQFHNGWASSPIWLKEGSAELVGFRGALIDTGLLSASQAQICQLSAMSSSSLPVGTLQSYENTIGNGEQSYSLFYLAIERLLGGRGINLLVRFTTFEGSFGTVQNDFYRDFEQYRTTLQPPARPACPGFNRGQLATIGMPQT